MHLKALILLLGVRLAMQDLALSVPFIVSFILGCSAPCCDLSLHTLLHLVQILYFRARSFFPQHVSIAFLASPLYFGLLKQSRAIWQDDKL